MLSGIAVTVPVRTVSVKYENERTNRRENNERQERVWYDASPTRMGQGAQAASVGPADLSEEELVAAMRRLGTQKLELSDEDETATAITIKP